MSNLHVTVVRVGDPPPILMPGVTVRRAVIGSAFILEAGMPSGLASIAFTATLPDGSTAFLEMSSTYLEMLAGILRGAEQEWRDGT